LGSSLATAHKLNAAVAEYHTAIEIDPVVTTRGQLEAPNANATAGVGAALKPYAYQLFTTYLLPVQVMGFLLLIAMLGVIVLSKKMDGLEDIK